MNKRDRRVKCIDYRQKAGIELIALVRVHVQDMTVDQVGTQGQMTESQIPCHPEMLPLTGRRGYIWKTKTLREKVLMKLGLLLPDII